MGHLIARPWIMRVTAIVAVVTMFVAVGAYAADPPILDNLTNPTSGFAHGTVLGTQDLPVTASAIVNTIISILGVVAVIIILIGGFKWMTAGGAEEKVDEARQMLLAGVIGLVIILAAYAIAKFVISGLVTATGAGTTTPPVGGAG